MIITVSHIKVEVVEVEIDDSAQIYKDNLEQCAIEVIRDKWTIPEILNVNKVSSEDFYKILEKD